MYVYIYIYACEFYECKCIHVYNIIYIYTYTLDFPSYPKVALQGIWSDHRGLLRLDRYEGGGLRELEV